MATRSGLPFGTITTTSIMAFTNGSADEKATAADVRTFMQTGVVATSYHDRHVTFPSDVAQGDTATVIRVPRPATLLEVEIWCDTAPTAASIIADVHLNGTTVFTTQSNRPTIATSTTSDVSGTPDVTALSAGDELQVIIDQLNAGTDQGNIGQLIARVTWTEA